jgi:hypothetical protein
MLFFPFDEGEAPLALPVEGATQAPMIAGGTHEIMKDFLGRLIIGKS